MTALTVDTSVAIIGAGTMGAGIAQVAAEAGHPVLLYDMADGAAEGGRNRIETGLVKLVERGKRTDKERADVMGRITATDRLDALSSAGLAIEAIVEDQAVKTEVFRQLESLLSDEAILSSNTSSLSISAISAGLARPERLVGMHFFNPAPVMKLVEVVTGLATAEGVADTVYDTAQAWGKTAVRATSTPGFIVNRIARPFYAEALDILETKRCDAATLDTVMTEGAGFRMGPLALMDLIGHDVNFAVTTSVFEETFHDPRYRPSHVQRELVATGWLGRKSGRGFYDYADGVTGSADHGVDPGEATAIPDFDFMAGGSADGVGIWPGDGHSAAWLASESGVPVLVYDLIPSKVVSKRLAFSTSRSVPDAVVRRFATTCLEAGLIPTRLADGAGLPVARTLAMLANEAFDLTLRGGSTVEDVDRAMVHGVNYPVGPIDWATSIGLTRLVAILDALNTETGDPRYRASAGLRQAALENAA